MITLPIVLSLFLLLCIAGGVYLYAEKRTTIPYTVLLVLIGFFIAFISKIFGFDFFTAFKLTPELLFYIFLPALIFEAAYNVKIHNFYRSFFSISLLSTLGLFISTAVIGVGSYYLLALFGFEVPLLVMLLFGSVISATDPVSVLSLFKSLGAPKRLSLIFEGESLFNDATAVALFVAIFAILQNPLGVTSQGIWVGTSSFFVMIISGVIVGLVLGRIFSWVLKKARHNEMATLSFMLVMAHLTFLCSEMANEFFLAHGYWFTISPIIATTIASMELGNDGGRILPSRVRDFTEKFWHQTTFFANSIVFLLVGILLVDQNIFREGLLLPMVLGALMASIARFISVYPLTTLISHMHIEEYIPKRWRILMSWAGIRGALSIIIVLTIPDSFTVSGWSMNVSPKEFIVALTLGSVVASLIGKTITIPFLLKKLGILKLNSEEDIMLSETKRFLNVMKKKKIKNSFEKGYISERSFISLNNDIDAQLEKCSLGDCHTFENVIEHYAIGTEKFHLENLYEREEINVLIYNRIFSKIDTQESRIKDSEGSQYKLLSESILRNIQFLRKRFFMKRVHTFSPVEQYLYYRAMAIIARKVLKHLSEKEFPDFYHEQLEHVLEKYTSYKNQNFEKMEQVLTHYQAEIEPVLLNLGLRMIDDYEQKIATDLIKTHFTNERVCSHIFNKTP